MKNLIFKILFFGAAVCLFCCGPVDSWEAKYQADVDQESKNYCLFAKNSYWVYQDSTTLEIDSIIITNVSHERTTSADYTRSFGFDEYTMQTTCFLNSYKDLHSHGSQRLTGECCDEWKVEKGDIKFIQLFGSNDMDKQYFEDVGVTKYHNGDLYENAGITNNCFYENFYESFQLKNNTFSEVKIFLSSFYGSSYKTRTYWAKKVGIIRTEYIKEDTNVFAVRNLIRYNVKPY